MDVVYVTLDLCSWAWNTSVLVKYLTNVNIIFSYTPSAHITRCEINYWLHFLLKGFLLGCPCRPCLDPEPSLVSMRLQYDKGLWFKTWKKKWEPWWLNGNTSTGHRHVLNAMWFCSVTSIPSYNRAFCLTPFIGLISFCLPGIFHACCWFPILSVLKWCERSRTLFGKMTSFSILLPCLTLCLAWYALSTTKHNLYGDNHNEKSTLSEWVGLKKATCRCDHTLYNICPPLCICVSLCHMVALCSTPYYHLSACLSLTVTHTVLYNRNSSILRWPCVTHYVSAVTVRSVAWHHG